MGDNMSKPTGPHAGGGSSMIAQTIVSYASECSFISAGDCGPKCFLQGSLIKIHDKRLGHVLVEVEKIEAGRRALSVDGEMLDVVRAIRHGTSSSHRVQVTELVAESGARMTFTDSHPVMTPDGPRHAGTLRPGQLVCEKMA